MARGCSSFAFDPSFGDRLYPDGVRTGQVVALNGVPRSGKSSIAEAVQRLLPGTWINLGVDNHIRSTPAHLKPGIGLRPYAVAHATDQARQRLLQIEAVVPSLYAALYGAAAAHARHGLNVVMDVTHHDAYSRPRAILPRCAAELEGVPSLLVGVRCPIEVIWARRERTWGQQRETVDDGVRAAVEGGQQRVHVHGQYDLDVDTSRQTPDEIAHLVAARLRDGPPGRALPRLASTISS